MTDAALPFGTRLWLAFACFFKILFDGAFAARVDAARSGAPALPPAPERESKPEPEAQAAEPGPPPVEPALQLLALLQRDGQLIDFLQQDVSAFGDADVGAAARAVHDRCAKALGQHASIVPVFEQDEGATVTLEPGFDPATVKLTGNVRGSAPYTGVLRHRGWRAASLSLPRAVGDHDASVLAPAEVEL